MPSCSARGCRNRGLRGTKVTFHLFPKNQEWRQRWIPVTGRKNWTPGVRAVLCSDHFEEPCFDRTGQTTRLRAGAIPTLGKFAPKNIKNQIFIKQESDNDHQRQQKTKLGITTRSGRQLTGQTIVTATTTLKKELSEEDREAFDPDDPALPLRSEVTVGTTGPGEAFADTTSAAHPDHFYCRSQNEMDALLKKSEQKIEYLKMKLDYLSSPKRNVKQEPPDWPQFRRQSLQKEADRIKALLKAGAKPVFKNNSNSEALIESDEQLRERIREAEELRKQIKTQQQKNRRQKKRSKAKFIRYVVMIEPTSKSGKKGTAALSDGGKEGKEVEEEEEGEEEEQEDEVEEKATPEVKQVSSLQDSILSHTASMVLGPNGLLSEKDKQIKDLQKKLKIAKQREKRKVEQLEHLQEVIEFLKEKCPEFSSQKEQVLQRHCYLCHSPLFKRCQKVAEHWAAMDVAQDQVSVPFSQLVSIPLPLKQFRSHGIGLLRSQRWQQINSGNLLCPNCHLLVKRSSLKHGSSLVHSLRPHC